MSPLTRPGWLAARLAAAYVLVVLIAWAFGDVLVEHLLPLYRLPVEWLLPEFRIDSLQLERKNGEPVVALQATLVDTLWVGVKYVPPGGGVTSSTLRGHALQPPIILYTLLLAWSGLLGRCGLLRLLLSVPLLLIIELVDVPLVLVGSIQDLLLAHLAPQRLAEDPLVGWMDFLNGGGRLALPLLAAVLSLHGGRAIGEGMAKHRPVGRDRP